MTEPAGALTPAKPDALGRRSRIAAAIRQDIMSGELRFGQRVAESAYAERFGVSRTPVREALLSLASLGLLDVRPQSGTYVVGFARRSLRELFDSRLIFETGGVRLSTSVQRADLVQTLRVRLAEMSDGVTQGSDFDAFSADDTAFHTALVTAADNPQLLRLYRPIEACAQAVRSRLASHSVVSRNAMADHQAMIEAIAANDLGAFEHRLRSHFAWVIDMLANIEEIFTPIQG